MQLKFLKTPIHTKLLFFILLASLLLRFTGLVRWMSFFGDQAWYYFSAKDALLSGQIPLQGITSSITWLHQGPIWTWLIIPILLISRFSPIIVSFFMACISLFAVVLAYYFGSLISSRRMGLVYSGILGGYYFSVVHSRLAYHTSPIALFFIISGLLFMKKEAFLGGLFLGFLYQSHLLTLVYWPLLLLFVIMRKISLNFFHLSVGFVVGILPFILTGPVATLGIFVWLLSRFVTGFHSTGLISEAYLVVFFPLFALVISRVFSCLSLKKLSLVVVFFFFVNYLYLINTSYLLKTGKYGIPYLDKAKLTLQIFQLSSSKHPVINITGPGSQFPTSRLPYDFLFWQQQYLGNLPRGKFSQFHVDESMLQLKVLE